MQKTTKFVLLCAICVLSAGVTLMAIGYLGGATPQKIYEGKIWNHTFYTDDSYENDHHGDNSYAVAADGISEISVDWTCGSVSVDAYDGDAILLEETAQTELSDETCLRYKTDGGKLEIEDRQDTAGVSFSSEDDFPEKQLTVKVPIGLARQMDSLSLCSVSSDIAVSGIGTKVISVETTSGDFTGKNLSAEEVSMDSISGSMQADYRTCPKSFRFDSTSGDCLIGLPEDSDAAVDFETASGVVYNHFGKHRGENHAGHHGSGSFALGNGGARKLGLNTVSGDIRICKGSCFN